MSMADWQSVFSTLWVVWFFVLFTGIIVTVMRPKKRQDYEQAGQIPFRDDRNSLSS
jgi:cytochrome c oxidase cbb3-type subunit 4